MKLSLPATSWAIACCALIGLVASGPVRAQSYDLINDFSNTTNPNGVWSYGQSAVRNGTFTLYTLNSSSDPLGSQLESWSSGSLPAVGYNASSNPVNFNIATVPSHDFWMHPGPGGQYTTVLFTAPTTGTYTITGAYTGADRQPTTTDDWVTMQSGATFTDLFNVDTNDFGVDHPFNLTTTLASGDSLRFGVGFGSNGNFLFDSTLLSTHITLGPAAVPEPGSLTLLFGMGWTGAGFLVRRRKR